MKFLFKRLLSSCYTTVRKITKRKKSERIISSTLHIFVSPITFIMAGLYFSFIGSIKYKFDSFTPIMIGLAIVMLTTHHLIDKEAKKAIFRWGIEKEYKSLTSNQRINRYIITFIYFWSSYGLFFYLATDIVGYKTR